MKKIIVIRMKSPAYAGLFIQDSVIVLHSFSLDAAGQSDNLCTPNKHHKW